MTRNWGIPSKSDSFRTARDAKPLLTLSVSAVFGVIGAAIAAISFGGARTLLDGLFQGPSLIAAVIAAGFGCWAYIFVSWSRFAAQFSGGDAFADLLRFYAKAAFGLFLLLAVARFSQGLFGPWMGGVLFCIAGGAAAAAAFQTVMTFVPAGEDSATG